MLNHAIESYLQVRRALGFNLVRVEEVLGNFARFATQRHETHVVTQTAIEWANQAQSPFERSRRLKTVIRFARYAHAEDNRHEIPPDGVFGARRPPRRVPFIFSPEEISKLIQQASHLRLRNTLVPHTYRTLFGLLAVTGLRVSEAFNLRLGDLTPDGLLIRETKFRKSRLVPIHETTRAALERYLERRRRLVCLEDYLFVSLRRKRLCYQSVRHVFHSLVRAVGIRPEAHLPHSLRHTFVLRALESSPEGIHRIGQHILALSTYLGHSSLASTFWYMNATPQLFTDIAERWEAYVQGGAQ